MSAKNVLELRPDVQEWADNVLKEWDRKVRALNISRTGALLASFINHVSWHAGGDLQKIEFMYNYYGNFVDWGVGNGVSSDTRNAKISVGLTSRRPKPWFAKTFYNEVKRLRHIISERTARNTQLFIVRSIASEE